MKIMDGDTTIGGSYTIPNKLSLIVRDIIERGTIKIIQITFFSFVRVKRMATDPLITFGQRLIELRKIKGWSQERLALESGLARSYVGGIERGQRNLALLNIYRLAESLEVAPSELLLPPTPTKRKKS